MNIVQNGDPTTGNAIQSPRKSYLSKKYILVILAILIIILASVISYNLGSQSGYSRGYSQGTLAGFNQGQIEMFVQGGTWVPLSPGAEYIMNIQGYTVHNFTISGQVAFTVQDYCSTNNCSSSAANGTAELYIQNYPFLSPLFTTGYVRNSTTNFTASINPNHPSYFVLIANPLNMGDIRVFWNSPLMIAIEPCC